MATLTILNQGNIVMPGNNTPQVDGTGAGSGSTGIFVATIDLSNLVTGNTLVVEFAVTNGDITLVDMFETTYVNTPPSPAGLVLGPFPSLDGGNQLTITQTVGVTTPISIPFVRYQVGT